MKKLESKGNVQKTTVFWTLHTSYQIFQKCLIWKVKTFQIFVKLHPHCIKGFFYINCELYESFGTLALASYFFATNTAVTIYLSDEFDVQVTNVKILDDLSIKDAISNGTSERFNAPSITSFI